MRIHKFYIGKLTQTGRAVSQSQWIATEEKLDDTFKGFTLYPSNIGSWRDEHGTIHAELTSVYECMDEKYTTHEDLARELAQLCDQRCVLYTYQDIQGKFVYAK